MAVFDFVHLGSSLSVRGIMRFGSRVESCTKLIFSNAQNYIHETDSNANIGFFVGNKRGMSITNAGGTLHGTWTADVSVSTSDRSLKENIKPLQQILRKNMAEGRGAFTNPAVEPQGAQRASASSWLLRQLRPVSYNFRQGNEAKHMRFGFIADELEKVLPQVVRELPDQEPQKEDEPKPEPKKGVVYTDLIAVLTSVVKDFNMQLKGMQGRMKAAEGELERLDKEDPMDDEEDV